MSSNIDISNKIIRCEDCHSLQEAEFISETFTSNDEPYINIVAGQKCDGCGAELNHEYSYTIV